MRLDRRLAWGGAILLALALAAGAAPRLGLVDPTLQPDGLVLRNLPPLARAEAILLANGDRQFAHEIRPTGSGDVEYRRGATWKRLPATALAGSDERAWHLRTVFWLGTDDFGRDLLSRLVHGARVSLAVGLVGALLAAVVGASIGLACGLCGGWLDGLLMRATDLILAVPRLFLALLLVSLWGASLTTTVLVLGGTTWMAAARIVRGEVLSARECDHVAAARAAGAGRLRLGFLHLLPQARGPLIVEGTLRVGDVILLEAALSFLGLGVPPPAPSWGNMVADGRADLLGAWWVSTFPGLAIALTVVSLNLVGDGLREGGWRTAPRRDTGRPTPLSPDTTSSSEQPAEPAAVSSTRGR